jgi:hypothetical protein
MTLHVPQDNSPIESQVVGAGTNADVSADAASDMDDGIAEDIDTLSGTNMEGTAYFDASAVDLLEGTTMTDIEQGDSPSTLDRGGDGETFDALIEDELREGETDDVMESVQEGLTYIPPIDPPVSPITDDPEGAAVATGFGLTSDEELDADDLETLGSADDDLTARVRRALRDDSLTLHLGRRLRIAADDGIVIVRGEVDDLTDSDNILAVLEDVPGVDEIRDETTVRGL